MLVDAGPDFAGDVGFAPLLVQARRRPDLNTTFAAGRQKEPAQREAMGSAFRAAHASHQKQSYCRDRRWRAALAAPAEEGNDGGAKTDFVAARHVGTFQRR